MQLVVADIFACFLRLAKIKHIVGKVQFTTNKGALAFACFLL